MIDKKTIDTIITYTINKYMMVKCRGSEYYYNQFIQNHENFKTEPSYNENEPPGRGEFEMKQTLEQRKVEFTEEEEYYVYDYTDEGYIRLNPMLWDNDDWHNAIENGWVLPSDIEFYKEEKRQLESAIEKAPRLTQDTVLYHGGTFDFDSLTVGDISNWKGFLSSSYREDISKSIFTGNGNRNEALIKINAPKGTKGVVITGSDPEFGEGREHEFLIKDNARFQVLNIDNSKTPFEVEILLLPSNYQKGYD